VLIAMPSLDEPQNRLAGAQRGPLTERNERIVADSAHYTTGPPAPRRVALPWRRARIHTHAHNARRAEPSRAACRE